MIKKYLIIVNVICIAILILLSSSLAAAEVTVAAGEISVKASAVKHDDSLSMPTEGIKLDLTDPVFEDFDDIDELLELFGQSGGKGMRGHAMGSATILLGDIRLNFINLLGGKHLPIPRSAIGQVEMKPGPFATVYGFSGAGGVLIFSPRSAQDDFKRYKKQDNISMRVKTKSGGGLYGSVTGSSMGDASDFMLGAEAYNKSYGSHDGKFNGEEKTMYSTLGTINTTQGFYGNWNFTLAGFREETPDLWTNNASTEASLLIDDIDNERALVGKTLSMGSGSASYSYNPVSKFVNLHIDGYFSYVSQNLKSKESTSFVNVGDYDTRELLTLGFDIKNISKIGSHTITYGFNTYTNSSISTEKGVDNTMNPSGRESIWGIFMQDKWDIKKITIVTSFRFDHLNIAIGSSNWRDETNSITANHSYSYNLFSPKFGVNYAITKTFSIYSNVALAYTPPKINELYGYGDYITVGEYNNHFNYNPNLDVQITKSTELGVKYFSINPVTKFMIMATVSGYFSVDSNYITEDIDLSGYMANLGDDSCQVVDVNNPNCSDNSVTSSYINQDATFYGVNMKVMVGHPKIFFLTVYDAARSENTVNNEYISTRGDFLLFVLRYKILKPLSIMLINKNKFANNRINNIGGMYEKYKNVPGYSIFNAKVKFKPSKNISFSLGVKNLFKKEYYKEYSLSKSGGERSYSVSMKLQY